MNDCPLCSKGSSVSFIKKYEKYEILYCSNCNFQFSDPMEDPGRSYYEQSLIYESRSISDNASVPYHDWRYQTFLKFYEYKHDLSLLDIGCGDGGFLSLAQKRGYSVHGIEIDERAVHTARKLRGLGKIECGRWEDISQTGWKNFDVITMFDVLEHISSPLSLVHTIFELLRPGGNICITVPRLDRYPGIFDPEADYPPHHFTLWSSNSLKVLLAEIGFKEIRIIEKPLLAEDLLIHLFWKTKRILSRIRERSNNRHPGESSEAKVVTLSSKTGIALRITKRAVNLLMSWLNWISRLFIFGRGHTLLAIATKSK